MVKHFWPFTVPGFYSMLENRLVQFLNFVTLNGKVTMSLFHLDKCSTEPKVREVDNIIDL